MKKISLWLSIGFTALLLVFGALQAVAQPKTAAPATGTRFLPRDVLAMRHFGNDAPWFIQNIPFFDCSDPEITQIYYYRWKLYKSHLKDLGERGYIATEFLNDVGWAWNAYQSLNDATTFHIMEGRWLKDSRYLDEYINYMYDGGNDRHFSEAIAAAVYARYLVNADRAFAVRNLEEMQRIYRLWDDHYDTLKGLYYIEPLLDATEYTIASIDTTGGRDGFTGGDAFRPSINAYMQANADAIGKLSALRGDTGTAREFAAKASFLKNSVQSNLWNDDLQHFVDRYKANNRYVKYGDFVRGRELVGYTPWYFNLPDNNTKYAAAWRHLTAPAELGGPFGLRTVEPSYEYYMKQYRYAKENGKDAPECQWNGPSWPYQTTLALGGMANFLNYPPLDNAAGQAVTTEDYIRLLKQYTHQHYQGGRPDIQEDYNPDTGQVIVGLPRSNHYNHSGYVDLVITGLAGLRPRADDVLEVNPLLPANAKDGANAIRYFCLENVPYHGQPVTILYDRDGKRYGRGRGLSIYINGRVAVTASAPGRKIAALPRPEMSAPTTTSPPVNLAVNFLHKGFPAPSASVSDAPDALYQAIDGRVWFYPNVRNYWSNVGSSAAQDWFSLDLGSETVLNRVNLYFYGDGTQYKAPSQYALEYWTGQAWKQAANAQKTPLVPLANGENIVVFGPVTTARLRVVFTNPTNAAIALVEMKVYGTRVYTPRSIIDAFYPDDKSSEASHAFRAEHSQSGSFLVSKWRTADNNGFFAFDLKTQPVGANELVVTYWGGETGVRHFDILTEGEKIAEQTLHDNQPGQFFEVTYPIPATLTSGKLKVTIRFQASAGAVAGGVFGARMVRGTGPVGIGPYQHTKH